jgi:hypothetical protein
MASPHIVNLGHKFVLGLIFSHVISTQRWLEYLSQDAPCPVQSESHVKSISANNLKMTGTIETKLSHSVWMNAEIMKTDIFFL